MLENGREGDMQGREHKNFKKNLDDQKRLFFERPKEVVNQSRAP